MLALVLAAAVLVQLPAAAGRFVSDDFLFLDQVRHRSLLATLTSPDPIGNFLRPVGRQLWFWVLAHASGESAMAFHLANLALFLAAVALLYAFVRRLAGSTAAAVASGILAVHYATDVPLLWASGSQDLLALVGALAALLLAHTGRRWAAAAALALALLSKETVAFTPLIALLADRRSGEPWSASLRREWPLAAAVAACGVGHVAVAGWRAWGGGAAVLAPSGLPAALVHLLQVVAGIELPLLVHAALPPPLQVAAIALAAAAVAVAAWGVKCGPGWGREPGSDTADAAPRERRAVAVGLGWAVLGALPVAAVSPIWSAYYYVFALCGAALALGAWVSRRPAWAGAALVAGLGLLSAGARSRTAFASEPSAWSAQSHVNRFYLERAGERVSRYLEDLRSLHPDLPHNSTLFFAGVSPFVGWQAGDGPLVRWAYRDSSLRSYPLSRFSLAAARRGPVFFFRTQRGSLVEFGSGPEELLQVAFSLLVGDRPAPARDVLTLARERGVHPELTNEWLAWAERACGDSADAAVALARSGERPVRGPAVGLGRVRRSLAAKDTADAVRLARSAVDRAGLDPTARATLADLELESASTRHLGAVEALAVRLLAPRDPRAWRRWGMVQLEFGRPDAALPSLERYVALAGRRARADVQVERFLRSVTSARRSPRG